MPATRLALGFAVVVALALALRLGFVSPAHAQEPDIQIVQLQCAGDPELVVIENLGDAPQVFPTGWELQSDPPDSEVFDLSALGGLQPGASVFIRSGPSASGVFKWGLEFVFRDGDPTDYARIVDNTGAVVHQVNCSVAPEPSPEPSPPGNVPNGGGPPPPPGNLLSPAMMVLIGGSVAAAGLAAIARPWLRLRHLVPMSASPRQELAAAPPRAQRRGANGFRGKPFSAAFGLALVGFAVAVALLLLLRRGG